MNITRCDNCRMREAKHFQVCTTDNGKQNFCSKCRRKANVIKEKKFADAQRVLVFALDE